MATEQETEPETDLVTVAAVRTGDEADEYLFYERPRIYALGKQAAADGRSASRLEYALDNKTPLKVTLNSRRGTIDRVTDPTELDLEVFGRIVPLEIPDEIMPIDVRRIDPTIFNLVHVNLKWLAFLGCTSVVPNYATAQGIFDFCAGLSCSLPGPYAVTPCIPFQDLNSGCEARAHQMRRIITTRYGYCCEKVFSFAEPSPYVLAVKADKWGSCCLRWWYHIAPLIRVRVTLPEFPKPLVFAMVVDPGLFDAPVMLSTWLSAQQNTCAENAQVTSYSIQPGEAYRRSGAGFTTDPTYALTDAALIARAGLTTC